MKQPTIVLLPCCSYILVTVDFTVMPANAKLVMTSLNVLGTVLGMGASTIGHVQLPAYQGQIKEQTVMAHRRTIEDGLVKHGLSLEKDVVLLFDKSNCRQSDSRASVQKCIAAFHKNFTPDFAACSAVSGNRVDTVPLLPVSEFYSYDDTAKPGPAERVETFLVTLSSAFCVSIEIFCLFFFCISTTECFDRVHVHELHCKVIKERGEGTPWSFGCVHGWYGFEGWRSLHCFRPAPKQVGPKTQSDVSF